MDEDKLHDESQPAADEAKAQRIEEEARGLKWCLKHDLVVWFDGPDGACPVCKMQNEEREQAAKEFLALTKDLK